MLPQSRTAFYVSLDIFELLLDVYHCTNRQVDFGVPLVDNNDLRQHRDLCLTLDEWLEMAREVPLQTRPVVRLVGGECRADRVAVGRKDRAEPNVQDLARVELIQQPRQIRIFQRIACRHLG